MERTRVLKPGSTLSSPSGPEYYEAKDLYVGATIDVFRRRFVLLDADEYVFNYLDSQLENNQATPSTGKAYAKSSKNVVLAKAREAAKNIGGDVKRALERKLREKDVEGNGVVERKALLEAYKQVWVGGVLDDHEVITLSRAFEAAPRKVVYGKLLGAVFDA
jgi:hypothetical protein